jgi:hypothetical protein
MEQREVERARGRVPEAAQELLTEGAGAIREVALLQYGDDPAVEPGQLVVRVSLRGAGAEDAQGREPGGPDGPDQDPLDTFRHAHHEALERFRDTIGREIPEVSFIEFTCDDGPGRGAKMRWRMDLGPVPGDRPSDLTPVMARLAPTDLQTLDTLITTGIAANRADAVRWALARIRERPAYAELRERARQIEELKTQF